MEHLTVRSLRAAVEKNRPLCLDVQPDGRGLDSLSSIRKDSPNTRVYMLAQQGGRRDQALRASSSNVLSKKPSAPALVAQLPGTAAHAGPGGAR